ncbi:DUF6571 family protein [Actinomyces capricornis]|uniref:DUF6571 domain-containing protein n=1 Tax=Actinomyces capricornis TaxID=2755559 RepID=A0ABN6K4W4_9ACTO|nr:DUF6571 family protein [Actinomyces capricornis]BDA64615.1 hypothetical protein MANAM107_14490 [Actinomyces capricornis]
MAFIKIDPDKVDTVASNLEERSGAVEEERKNIDNTSSDNHDPVPSVVTATEAFSVAPVQASPFGFGAATTFNAAAQGLRDLAEELRTRSQEARNLNSSGVTMTNDDGTLSYYYYLPDPPEGTVDTEAYWNNMDTATNVREYNSKSVENARAESAELIEAIENGKSSKGRTVDEIMAEISKHQDVLTYGLTFVTTWTPEGYLNLQNDLDPAHIPVLAHNLAAATQNEGSGASLAKMYDEATQGDDTILMTTRLNHLLTAPETYFGTEFLVDLADRLEERPYDAIRAHDQVHPNKTSIPDPMAGVLTAMGNNPEAALTYLVPNGEMGADGYWLPGAAAQERWDRLSSRNWSPEGRLGFTGAIGGASALRVLDAEGSTDERAAWITGNGITYLADQGTDYSPKEKKNIAIIIGNSMREVEEHATNSSTQETSPFYSQFPAGLQGDHSADISKLTGIVGSDDAALTTLSNAAGRHSTARTQAIIDAYPRAILGDGSDMDGTLKDGARRDGQLLGFISQSAIDSRSLQDKQTEIVSSSILGGFSAGLSAVPHPAAQGMSVGISAITPGLTEASNNAALSRIETVKDMETESKTAINQSMIAQLANNDRLPDGAYINHDDPPVDYSTKFDWMGPDHRIDIESVMGSEKNQKDFNAWMADPSIPAAELMDLFEGGIKDGKNTASE